MLTFTGSQTRGCGALGDPQQPLFGVAKPDIGCQNLAIGVYAAKAQECTDMFDSFVLWSERDCRRMQTSVQNVRGGLCKPGFFYQEYGVYWNLGLSWGRHGRPGSDYLEVKGRW